MLFLRGWDPPSDGAREGKAVGAVMRWAPITLFDEGSWPMVRNLIDSAIIHTRATVCQRFEVTRRAQPYQPPARRFTGEIGRASCRERVEIEGESVALKKKEEEDGRRDRT